MDSGLSQASLLSGTDPAAVHWHNPDVKSPILILCEHAGNRIPNRLGTLGLTSDALDAHIAWDIGAEGLARRLSDRLSAPLILQRYSRLVIDCNRPPGSPGSICQSSDGVAVPGNADVSPDDQVQRRKAIFDPLDTAISHTFSNGAFTAAFSIHSFTPEFAGTSRPWHAGILTRKDTAMANALMRDIRSRDADLRLSLNEPYQIEDDSDWFIPAYAEPLGLRHALIEVRNDQLRDEAGQDRWADLLASAIQFGLETSS